MKNRIMDMGRGEERVRYMESNMETYITICKIDSQWEFAVWLVKLKQGLCINLEGWDGEGGGREVQKGGDVCIPMAKKGNPKECSNYCTIALISHAS